MAQFSAEISVFLNKIGKLYLDRIIQSVVIVQQTPQKRIDRNGFNAFAAKIRKWRATGTEKNPLISSRNLAKVRVLASFEMSQLRYLRHWIKSIYSTHHSDSIDIWFDRVVAIYLPFSFKKHLFRPEIWPKSWFWPPEMAQLQYFCYRLILLCSTHLSDPIDTWFDRVIGHLFAIFDQKH